MINRVIGLMTIILSVMLISTVHAITPETNIITNNFNITFDNLNGGVMTSLQYKGTEFLTGPNNGAWGAIGIRKSTWNGTGDVCTRWATDMDYQYDENNYVHVENKSNRYVVTITPIHPTLFSVKKVVGREITWTISKKFPKIDVKYKPVNNNEYLYFPLIRDYDLKQGKLTFFTVGNGLVQAQDLPYCESRGYKAPFIYYKIKDDATGKISGLSIYGNQMPQTVKYYGNDTNTWQLHYPMKQTNQRTFHLNFYNHGFMGPI